MSQPLTWSAFLQQYKQLRNVFIPALLETPVGSVVRVVEGVHVQLDGQARVCTVAPGAIRASPSSGQHWGADVSLQMGRPSCVGMKVEVYLRPGGQAYMGTLVGFQHKVDELELYKLLMRQPYQQIHEAGLWHALRLYHRIFMAGQTTEALAEMIGSFLSKQVRHQDGRRASLHDVLNAVHLRSLGVGGHGGDTDFLRRCLNIYFRGKDWHFLVRSKRRTVQGSGCRDGIAESVVLTRYRLKNQSRGLFHWLDAGMQPSLQECARRNFKSGLGALPPGGGLSTPRASHLLSELSSVRELQGALRALAGDCEPHTIDAHVWSMVHPERR